MFGTAATVTFYDVTLLVLGVGLAAKAFSGGTSSVIAFSFSFAFEYGFKAFVGSFGEKNVSAGSASVGRRDTVAVGLLKEASYSSDGFAGHASPTSFRAGVGPLYFTE